MPNTFITPDLIARLAYANLYENAVMAGLVHRDYEADFRGAQGATVTIRKPAVFEAEEYDRTQGITVQSATESSIPVVLDTLLDVSFEVTAEQLTLEVSAFNEQLLMPATEAIRQGIDRKILTLRDDVTQSVGVAPGETWDDPLVLVDAGRVLDQAKVPATQRACVAGPITSANWTKDPLFHQADQRGDTEGLREASIGRKFGFDNFMSQNIAAPAEDPDPGDPTTEVNVAFHRTAFALVTRTLALPQGAANAAVFSGNGFGIRVVQDYDIDLKKDIVSLDILIGVKTLDATRAVLTQGEEEGS